MKKKVADMDKTIRAVEALIRDLDAKLVQARENLHRLHQTRDFIVKFEKTSPKHQADLAMNFEVKKVVPPRINLKSSLGGYLLEKLRERKGRPISMPEMVELLETEGKYGNKPHFREAVSTALNRLYHRGFAKRGTENGMHTYMAQDN